jgi:hypothetical protein
MAKQAYLIRSKTKIEYEIVEKYPHLRLHKK